jgi:hypothetical protein
MNDDAILILLLLITAIVLWLLVFGPKVKQARAERERRAAAEAERRAAERARLKAEREVLLKKIRGNAPDFILRARLEFEREYRAVGGEGSFGQEMSPLVCFGYHVGKTIGRIETERHSILEYAVAADLDTALPFLPESYRSQWGAPLSIIRFNRIYTHLNNNADRQGNQRNLDVAVSQWRADAAWFHSNQLLLVEKFTEI